MHRCDTRLLVLAVISALVLRAQCLPADDTRTSGSGEGSTRHGDVTQHTEGNLPSSTNMVQNKEQTEQLESTLLTMFGLSKRPRPSGKVQVPQHMIDMYKLQAGITGDLDIDTSRRRIKRHPGNTVRSFYTDGEFIYYRLVCIRTLYIQCTVLDSRVLSLKQSGRYTAIW